MSLTYFSYPLSPDRTSSTVLKSNDKSEIVFSIPNIKRKSRNKSPSNTIKMFVDPFTRKRELLALLESKCVSHKRMLNQMFIKLQFCKDINIQAERPQDFAPLSFNVITLLKAARFNPDTPLPSSWLDSLC